MVTLTDEQAELIWGFLKSVEKHPVGQELTYRTIEVDGRKRKFLIWFPIFLSSSNLILIAFLIYQVN